MVAFNYRFRCVKKTFGELMTDNVAIPKSNRTIVWPL